MFTKVQIAKMLIVGGFFLYLMNYGLTLISFYDGQDTVISLKMEDSEEKSESKEKESSEKEDFKEKDKITQDYSEKDSTVSNLAKKPFPDFYLHNVSVDLEFSTPPPEYS